MVCKILSFIPLLSDAGDSATSGAYDFIPFFPEWFNMLLFFIALIAVPVILVIVFVGMYKKVFGTIWYVISLQPLRRKMAREKLSEAMDYYRDIPAAGNLKVASAVMNSLSSALVADYTGLFGALILRLIDREALRIDFKSNMYGAELHTILSIGEWKGVKRDKYGTGVPLKSDSEQFERQFFEMMRGAAGSDGILQPRELRQYLRRHPTDPFFSSLRNLTYSEKEAANSPETGSQLLALKKYLLDFSLIGERDISEMTLWKEYLVYATLFGIADKVSDSFSKVYPDYFKMNRMAGTRLSIVGNRSIVRYSTAAVEGMAAHERLFKSQPSKG